MREKLFICCLIIGILNVHSESPSDAKSTPSTSVEPTASAATQSIASTPLTSMLESSSTTAETAKDKRQIGSKDEVVYANHRSDTVDTDDPENPQETIYGPKPNQFIIRPIAPHEHQQHEDHQEPQLRNYPATVRPHNTQSLEQSQEIQHFAYLQDISRNHPKSSASASELTGKPHQTKKSSKSGRTHSTPPQQYRNNAEEAEQRYAIAIQAPNPTSAQAPHYSAPPPQQIAQRYHLAAPQHQQQYLPPAGQPGAPQQPYQIIPEDEFLKLLEEELRARAYHEAQYRQQQVTPTQQHDKAPHPTERVGQGLGRYRQQAQAPQPQVLAEQPAPQYVQYVPRHRGGPRYLPQPQQQVQQQLQQSEPQTADPSQEAPLPPPPPPHIPPQLAYYQPQVNYKSLQNHPLAKSSLENEIEKLLAANKPSISHLTDNSNEPSGVIHHHAPQQELQPQPIPRSRPYALQQKAYTSQPTPTPLVDANNQPFIPSLFKFSNSQQPQPIYATQIPQHIVESKKLGPVVYPPTQAPTPAQQQQPTQYFYQELTPTARPKTQRSKQYGSKSSTSSPKLREKEPPNYPNVPAAAKYLHPHLYYEQPNNGQNSQQYQQPIQFHPSPPDPNNPSHEQHQQQLHQQLQPQAQAHHYEAPSQLPPQRQHTRQYVPPAPSQSSIFVSQGTGITTPSRSTSVKPSKSIEDVRQLQLPQPGGKPLTQREFQALIDAGYPVTAVPVPVPVPYEQYIKEHPELRNQPLDYAQLMQRIAQQYGPRRGLQAQPSEQSPNIAPDDGQTATATGGGSVTYLRPVSEQKRHPRDEKDTAVAGKMEETKQ